MTDWYIEPTANDTAGIYEFFRYVNNVSSGLFFPVILLVVWIISFITMLFSGSADRPSASKAWVFSSFLTMVLAIPLTVMDLVASKYMYMTILFLGIGVLWLILENARE